ncbi:MAG TPA: DUF2905 domain-containing protein [candidate division WOR-3 bacterium]|uniref:DUF2905 domain-containing protein n=1 Tax=candidate division WOR-3 bacterium TaxID=2052148 RepID=A0A7V0Q680_UNCW3|nr:MAG: DUF2905 domain-containing protein [Candidatus Hydrothermae bacterium]HDL60040.1 DUF2905 domain-containing protein [candidate division WOR-3 bacterium]
MSLGKIVIYIGVLLIIVGLIMLFVEKTGFRIPGDIVVKKDGFTLYLPIMTSIILSLILTIIINIIVRLLK